jgi:hypothetical protein
MSEEFQAESEQRWESKRGEYLRVLSESLDPKARRRAERGLTYLNTGNSERERVR